MIDEERVGEGPGDGFVPFRPAGEEARGAFQCSECGYGIVVTAALPACPMCGGAAWEESPGPPLGRTRGVL